jgi:large conductance mechanosensitive channel
MALFAGYSPDCGARAAGRLPQREVIVGEFKAFLKEYGVIGLALGVIIGGKAGELVTSIVDGLLMPIVGMMLPSGDWQKLVVGPFQVGIVLAALIKFIVVAYFVFFVSKKLLREETVSKK